MEKIKITKALNGYYQLSKPNVEELEVVAVDDKLKTTIGSMFLLLRANIETNTEGERLLEEWEEYFKPLVQK